MSMGERMGQDTPLSIISQAMHPDTTSGVGRNTCIEYLQGNIRVRHMHNTVCEKDFHLSPQLLRTVFSRLTDRRRRVDGVYISYASQERERASTPPRPRSRVSQTARSCGPSR